IGGKEPLAYKRGSNNYFSKGGPWEPQEKNEIQLFDTLVFSDKQGNEMTLKLDPESNKPDPNEKGRRKPIQYLDVKTNQVMTPEDVRRGQVSVMSWGLLLVNLLLNILFLALWFACLWPLLRFQMSHALGLAVVLWLVLTLTIVPMLLEQ